MKKFKVAKFGGASNRDSINMLTSGRVLNFDPEIRVVVISAIAGMTNALIEMGKLASTGDKTQLDQAQQNLTIQGQRHLEMGQALHIANESKKFIEQCLSDIGHLLHGIYLLKELTPRTLDLLVSYGELMSSRLFHEALRELGIKSEWFDIRQVMITDDHFGKAEPDLSKLKQLAQQKILPNIDHFVVVTQGYIGRTPEGLATTLGKEGSDYTTALLAEALELSTVQIWKDVDGIYTTDPKLVPNAKVINEISFEETAEYTFYGAKVLHPKTMKPAIRNNISVYIGNSSNPTKPGSWVKAKVQSTPKVRGLALRKKQHFITITPKNVVSGHEYYSTLFKDLWHYNIEADISQISETTLTLVLNDTNCPDETTITHLREKYQVNIESNLALLTVIGNGLDREHGLVSELINILSDQPIKSVFFGSSKHSLSFLLQEAPATQALSNLHRKYLS